MELTILLSVFIALCYSSPLSIDKCNEGPTYWCTDKQTAELCGVVEFCQNKLNHGGRAMKERGDNSAPVNLRSPPVNVSLYYEALCPGCRALIMSQIYPTYLALKSTGILNLHMYPYGNANEKRLGQTWEFTCQHGRKECRVNMLETCALHLLPPNQKLPFVHCIEEDPSLHHGKYCAQKLNLKWQPLYKCYNSSQGNYLEHQVAQATDKLEPSHKYVPWITVNGVHTEEIQSELSENMLLYVCNSYAGKVKPKECFTKHVGLRNTAAGKALQRKCYNDQK